MKINHNSLAGICFFITSLLIGVLNDVIMKYIGKNVSFHQVVFLRFAFATLTLLPVIFLQGVHTLKTNAKTIHLVRGSLLFFGIAIWCYSLNIVQITLATVINFTMPIFVLILAKLILKENVGLSRWMATIVGFAGVLIAVTKSDIFELNSFESSSFESGGLLLLLGAVMFSLLDVINKKYVYQESLMSMMFYSNITVTLLSLPFALKYWVDIDMEQTGLLFILGIGANLMLYFLIKAFGKADASALVPYRYFELVIAGVMGYIFFSEIPHKSTVLGALFIIPSTLFMSYFTIKAKQKKIAH